MNNSISLLELLREQKKKKNRPLKVICDWDECIQPLKPLAVYEIAKPDKVNFKEFFERFWEIAVIKGSFSGNEGRITGVEGTDEEKEAFNKYSESIKVVHDYDEGERLEKEIKKLSDSITKAQGEVREELESKKGILVKKKQDWENKIQGKRREQGIYWKNYYRSPEWIEKITNAPFLSITSELLLALQEGLIKELVIISSYRKGRGKGQGVTRKTGSFPKFFGKFPQAKLELTEVGKDENGKYVPYRWQRMNEIMPDWDIFIDDNPNIVNETIKNVPDPDKNKVYVLPDYKNCRKVKGDNVYLVKNTISDLKDEDFEKAAQELKDKKKKEIEDAAKKQREEQNSLWKKPSTYLALIGGVSLTFLVVFFLLMVFRKKRK